MVSFVASPPGMLRTIEVEELPALLQMKKKLTKIPFICIPSILDSGFAKEHLDKTLKDMGKIEEEIKGETNEEWTDIEMRMAIRNHSISL